MSTSERTLSNLIGGSHMSRSALIVYGGWEGHQPYEFTQLIRRHLQGRGYQVTASDSLETYDDGERLKEYDLIVPMWTMGELTKNQEQALLAAVESGVGLGGWHGGMGDAFRRNLDYNMMVGGQFVSHPGNILEYQVEFTKPEDSVVRGLETFSITSEQYYMHVDPTNEVLATTTFSGDALPWLEGVTMPVVWKRQWGKGRVFYSSLGHQVGEFEIPQVWALTTRGLEWASR
jgi:type 1 glutamine amidotransferase